MRVKPLINEGNLQKITKQPHFQIRNKLSQPRPPTAKSLKSIDHPPLLATELEVCLEGLEGALQREGRCERDLCERLVRLLVQVRGQWAGGEEADRQSIDRQSTPQLMRKSSSKCTLRMRCEGADEFRFYEGGLLNQRGGLELKKTRSNKLKIGEENVDRYPVSLEIKMERLNCKLEQSQRVGTQLREEVKRLSERIKEVQRGEKSALEQKERAERAGREVGEKLSAALGRMIQVEADLGFRIIQAEHRIEELVAERTVMEGWVGQREREITAMWQLSL